MPKKKNDSKGKATNWVKNFGQSVKFSAVDVLSELAPATKDTAESASTVLQNVVKDLRGLKIGQNRLIQELNTIPAFKYAKEAKKNAISDIKSGKLNNQNRLEKMVEAENGDFDEDDFDFSMDDSDMSFEPSEGEEAVPSGESEEFNADVTEAATAAAKPIAETLRPGVNATAVSTRHTAIATEQFASGQMKQTKAMVSGFEATNKVNSQIAAMQFTMTNKFHEENITIFNNMNTNIEKLVRFNDETLSKQAMGSLKFFEDQLTATNNILAEIQKIREAVAPEKPEQDELEKSQYSQLFKGNGVMKFGNYGAILKQNFLAAADSDPFLSMLKEFLTNEEALKSMAANPLGFVTTKLVTNLLPNIVKTTMKELDKSIAGFFPALFAKINAQMDSDNPIKSLLGKIFGLQTDVRTTPDFSQYEKGAVPFDGVTRTAITSVIPNYLSGILAALTGKEEQTFDYEKGTFTTKYAMMKEMNEDEENRLTSGYGKVMSEMQKNLETFIYESDKDRKATMDGLKDFLINLTLNQKAVDINKVETFGGGDVGKRLKAAFKAMDRGTQMGLYNAMFKSGKSQNDFINEMERERPDLLAKYQSVQGGFMSNLHGTRDEHGTFKIEKGNNPFVPVDKFGYSQLDYLHDIKQALVDGIIVYPNGTSGTNPNGPSGGPGIDPNILKRKADLDAENKRRETEIQERENEEENRGKLTEEETEEQKQKGKIGRDALRNISGDDTSTLEAMIRTTRSANSNEINERNAGGIWEWLNKTLNGRTFGENIDKIKESIGKFLKMPVDFFVNAAEHVDKTLYTIIYGDEDSGEGILSVTLKNIKNTFSKMNNWIRAKFDDFGAWLFDGDFAGTQMYKWVKGKANDIFDYMFGKKTGEDGHRSGGALSESFNALKDFGLSVRSELFGTAYKDSSGKDHPQNTNSVFHNIKNGVGDALNAMKVYLFGPEKVGKDGKKKSFMDQIADSLGEGFANWKNFFFGEKLSTEQGQAKMKEVMNGFKKAMPKAMAVGIVGAGVGMVNMMGGFGLLGSVFLPGGPIGGAILGTGLGLLGQSEKFKKFLFGEKGVDGKRMGGIISKGVMDWVAKHKVALLGGATFGATKGLIGAFMPAVGGPIGFMGSFLLPGGPITGALMGAAVGIAWKSKTFQEFLYGKDDGTGKKMGGILNSQMGSAMKKHLPNMAIGAAGFGGAAALIGQMGFMGAMLTPGGPIGAAILGAAMGIGISSEKFKNFLFGKKDDQTGIREGGLFGQVKHFFKVQFAAPFVTWMQGTSENIRHWFVDKISIPFKASLKPFQVAMKNMVSDIEDMFKNGWKYLMGTLDGIFERAVGLPLAKFVAEKVVDPMKKFMNTLINGIGKAFGFILSSPVKAMHFMAMSLAEGQQKRGIRENRDEKLENLKSAGGGLKDWFLGKSDKSFFENLKDVISAGKDAGKAYLSDEGKNKHIDLDEIKKEEKRLREEEDKKHAGNVAEIDQKKQENDARAQAANDANYHNVIKDENGVSHDIRALYDLEVPMTDLVGETGKTNDWLDKLTNLTGAIAAKVTGNPKAQDYAAKNNGNKPGSPSVPSDLKLNTKEQNTLKSEKKHDEHIAENQEDEDKEDKRRKILDRMAERRRKEMEHNAALGGDVINLGPAPEKETPGAPSGNQNVSDNGDGTTAPKKGKRFSLHNLLGRGFKFKFNSDADMSKFIDMLPGQESMNPEAYAKMQAHLDRLMNRYLSRDQKDKKQTQEAATQVQAAGGVAANQGSTPVVNGPINKQTVAAQQKKARAEENAAGVVESSADRKFDSKNGIGKGGTGVDKAIKYLRIIASNVDGQLNGVGSNVYKSRKILESITGVSGDTVGSGNRDRTTWIGRFGRIFKMMIFNPVAFMGEIISKPIEIITDLGKKVYDTIWNVVDGIGSMLTKTGELLFDAGKAVVETVAAVPKMVVNVVKGAAEVVAETAKAGIKVIGEGLVGVTKATFTIVTSAGEALGSILTGLGKGLKDTFIGLGKISKSVLEGIGKGVKAAVDVAGEVAKSTVKIGTAMTEAVTKVASESIVQVGKLATNLITSVGNLITSATGTLFSIAASPFKFLGKLGGNLIQRSSHVIIDSGHLNEIDNVKVVEVVRLVERIGGSPLPETSGQNIPGGTGKKAKNAGDSEKPEAPGTPSTNQETKEEKESKEEKKKRENAIAEGKEGAKKTTASDEKKKEEKPGKPAASNITAEMKESGLAPAEGNMQRTAANMKATEKVNADKKYMKDVETREANDLDVLVKQGKDRESFWKKFWKWLMAGVGMLWAWLKKIWNKIPSWPGIRDALGGAAKRFAEKVEKSVIVKYLKSKIPSGLKKLGSKIVNLLKDIRNKIFGKGGKEAGEKVAKEAGAKGLQSAAKKKLPQIAAKKATPKLTPGKPAEAVEAEVVEDVVPHSGGKPATGQLEGETIDVKGETVPEKAELPGKPANGALESPVKGLLPGKKPVGEAPDAKKPPIAELPAGRTTPVAQLPPGPSASMPKVPFSPEFNRQMAMYYAQGLPITDDLIKQEIMRFRHMGFPVYATEPNSGRIVSGEFTLEDMRKGKKVGNEIAEEVAKRARPKNLPTTIDIVAEDAGGEAVEKAGKVAVDQGAKETVEAAAEKAGGEAVETATETGLVTLDVPQIAGKTAEIPMYKKLICGACETLEKCANAAASKLGIKTQFSFAEKFEKAIFSKLTDEVIKRFSSKFAAAAAKMGLSATPAKLITNAIFVGFGAAAGYNDAAHMFKVNEKSVTAVMRLCAVIVKAIMNLQFIPVIILDVVAIVLGAISGQDPYGWMAYELYTFMTDEKAAQELEAAQLQFKNEAAEAGYVDQETGEVDVDAYNDKTNKTLTDKVGDAWRGFKNSVGDAWRNTFGYTDENGEEHKGWVEKGWDNNLAWLAGQNDENGNYQPGVFARAHDYILGKDDEESPMKKDIKDYIYSKFTNTIDWFFGVKPGATDNLVSKISAFFFGKNDENGNYQGGIFANAKKQIDDEINLMSKSWNETWENTKADFNKRIENNKVYLFGGTDPYTGEERKGVLVEFFEKWIKPIKEKYFDPLAENFKSACAWIRNAANSLKTKIWNPLMVGFFGESDYTQVDEDGNVTVVKGKKSVFAEIYDTIKTKFKNGINEVVYQFRKLWHDLAVRIFGNDFVGPIQDPRDLGDAGDNDANQIGDTDQNITGLTQTAGFSGGGIGDEDYLQTKYRGVQYGNVPGMGDFSKAGCAPAVMSKIYNESTGSEVSPTDMGQIAETMGERVPGGTSESFFSDVGGSHMDSFSDAINAVQNGQKVAIGGKGTSYIGESTDSGHYMELEGINGTKAEVFDPLKGHREVSLDSLARQTETAYSFSGGGIADDVIDALELPDLSQADTSNGMFPGYLDAYAKWFIESGGPIGLGVKVFKAGFKGLANWLFGGIDNVDPNYFYNLITQRVPEILEGWYKTLKEGLQEKWNDVKEWIFSNNNLSKDSILDTFKNGLKWAADKLGRGGTGDNIARIEQHMKFSGGGKALKPAPRIPHKKFSFAGGGNTMYMPEQSQSNNCTTTAAAALINAYTGSQHTSDDYSFNNWYESVLGMPSSEAAFQPGSQAEFNSTVESHFSAHPEWPVYLYQTGGGGSSSGHALNRGSGNHATIIGRKLSNGSYEIYDSNGGRQVQLSLDQIFDPTAEGSSSQGTTGQGNLLLIPDQGPSQPITEWGSASGGSASGASSAAANSSAGGQQQQEEQKGLLETMTSALNDVFESVRVGASGKVWSPAAKIASHAGSAPSGAMGPAPGKGAENIPAGADQHYIDVAVRASNLSGIPADWIWAQWANEARPDFSSDLARNNHNLAGLTVTDDMPGTESGGHRWGLWDSDEAFADYWGGKYIKLYTGATDAKTMRAYVEAIQNQPDGQNYCADPPGVEDYYSKMLSLLGNQGTVVGSGFGDFYGGSGIDEIRKIILARRMQQIETMKKNGGKLKMPRVTSKQRKFPGSNAADKANVQYDDLGNIRSLNIPEYNIITSNDSKTVIDAKKAAQQKLLEQSGFLGNGFGADLLRRILIPTGIFKHARLPEGSILQTTASGAPAQNEPVEAEVAPNGLHYTTNDVEYLLKQGYTRADALAFLATDPKYTTDVGLGTNNGTSAQKQTQQQQRPAHWWEQEMNPYTIMQSYQQQHNLAEAAEVAPNGRHYLQNDIDYLIKQGYSREDAIALLSKDPKYTQPYTETPGTASQNQYVQNRLPSQHEPVEPEVAPNGLHYTTNDLKYVMENNKVSREEALKILSMQSKYTDPITAADMKYEKPDRSLGKRKHGGAWGWALGMLGLNKVGYKMKDIREKNKWMNVKSETMAPEVAPNGAHYSENDINHLLNNGYSREDAIALLSKDPKYTQKTSYTSRGTYTFKPEDENKPYYYGAGPQDELLARRARQVEALRQRGGRPLIVPPAPQPQKYTFTVPSLLPEEPKAPTLSELVAMAPTPTQSIPEEHTPSLLETLNAMRIKHGKKPITGDTGEGKFVGSTLLDNNLKTPTVVGDITQSSVDTFNGGEYFNDVSKVAPEAKAYVRGEGDLLSVAKAIGFDDVPPGDTPLTAAMQQALGFREYSPIRTWNHYLTSVQLWKRSGMTAVERWMQFHGSGIGIGEILRGVISTVGMYGMMRQHVGPFATPTGIAGPIGQTIPQQNEPLTNVKAPNGLYYTKNDVDYLINQGYSWDDAIALLSKDPKYTTQQAPGSVSSNQNVPQNRLPSQHEPVEPEIAPNGLHYTTNDLKYVMENNKVSREEALKILSTQSKYTDPITAADMKYVKPDRKKGKRKHGGFFGWIGGMLGINKVGYKMKDIRESNPWMNVNSETMAPEIALNGAHYSENDINHLLNAGYSREDAIALLSKDPKYTQKVNYVSRGVHKFGPEAENKPRYYGAGIQDELLARRARQVEELRRRGGRPLVVPQRPQPQKYTFNVPSLLPEPVYTKPTLSELAAMAPSKTEEHTPTLLETLNAMRRKHGKEELLVGKDVKFTGSELLDNNLKTPTVVGDITQSSIDTFTGGEYFNDVSKVAPEALAYVRGEGDLFAVAKAIGFNGLPSGDTPLTAGMQQALGFREYSPIRTWNHYLTSSQLWKRSGMTAVERWMKFNGGGIGDELLARRARQVEALRLRGGRPLITPPAPQPQKYTFNVPSLLPEPVYTKPTLSELAAMAPAKTEEHTPTLLETLNALRIKHGKKPITGDTGEGKFVGSTLLDNNLKAPTVIGDITQSSVDTFTGGEYFNDVSKVAPEALAYVRGEGDLLSVAKAIGFDDLPSGDTPLTAGMQQALGFREYSPIRTWNHYLTSSQLWKRSGMTAVERWMKFNGGGPQDELLARRARQVEELRRRGGRPLITPPVSQPQKYTFDVPSLLPEPVYKKPTLSELAAMAPSKTEEHTPTLLETLNAMRKKHGKEELLVGKNVKFTGSELLDNNLKTPTVVGNITQSGIDTFTGGEYFNDVSKVAPEALAYVRGEGDLFAVAKAIGFNGLPSGDTPLTAGMQQALGFREYSPIRTWNHYLTASQLWKRSGMTAVERWMKFNGGGFVGSGINIGNIFRGIITTVGMYGAMRTHQGPFAIPTPTGIAGPINQTNGVPQQNEETTNVKAPNGLYYTKNDMVYLTNKGYSWDDAIDLLSKDPKYTTPINGSVAESSQQQKQTYWWNNPNMNPYTIAQSYQQQHNLAEASEVAPNGRHYLQNDIDYLIKQGYSRADAIALLSKDPKYTQPYTPETQSQRPGTAVMQKPKFNQHEPIEPEEAPNGLHYTTNDLNYTMENYKVSREEAIKILSKQSKYTDPVTAEDLKYVKPDRSKGKRKHGGLFGWIGGMLGINKVGYKMKDIREKNPWMNVNSESVADEVASNGAHYSENDINYLLSQGYSREDAIAFLSKDKKYTQKVNYVSRGVHKFGPEAENKPYYYGGGTAEPPTLLETLNAMRKKHGKEALIMGKDTKYVGSDQALKNLQTPTVFNGVTQADITSFTGGEYFNAEDKITPEAKAYARGEGDLWAVAKSIGFNGLPTEDTPLTANMQQMLGFREYSPVRTWAHYLTESELWRRGGMTSAERWIHAVAPKAAPSDEEVKAPTVADTLTTGQTEVGKALDDLKKIEEQKSANNSNDLFSKMVDILQTIATNTGNVSDGIKNMGQQRPSIYMQNSNGSTSAVPLILQNLDQNRMNQDTREALSTKKANDEFAKQIEISKGGEFVR